MTGLDLSNVCLRAIDAGTTWQQVSDDAFESCINAVTNEGESALVDCTVLRGVSGFYLPCDPKLPQTGFLHRSDDGTKTWGKPEVPWIRSVPDTFCITVTGCCPWLVFQRLH